MNKIILTKVNDKLVRALHGLMWLNTEQIFSFEQKEVKTLALEELIKELRSQLKAQLLKSEELNFSAQMEADVEQLETEKKELDRRIAEIKALKNEPKT